MTHSCNILPKLPICIPMGFIHEFSLKHLFNNLVTLLQNFYVRGHTQPINFHWNILSTNLKHCCLSAHEFSMEHSFNKFETLLSYKDETNLQHFARIALKKNCCHIKMTQNCSIFAKIVVKKSKVVSPLIFIGAFFQQT